jgi:hypothetical protein
MKIMLNEISIFYLLMGSRIKLDEAVSAENQKRIIEN